MGFFFDKFKPKISNQRFGLTQLVCYYEVLLNVTELDRKL